MQNVLNFPSGYLQKVKPFNPSVKKSPVKKIINFIKLRKSEKEKIFQQKFNFLVSETYNEYLNKILIIRQQNGEVDFAEWMYKRGLVKDCGVYNMAKETVEWINNIYGRHHIEQCYKKRIKQLKRKFATKK